MAGDAFRRVETHHESVAVAAFQVVELLAIDRRRLELFERAVDVVTDRIDILRPLDHRP